MGAQAQEDSSSNVDLPNFFVFGKVSGKDEPVLKPEPHFGLPGSIKDLIVGDGYYVALLENGQIWSWGVDKDGCLGLGEDCTKSTMPRMLITEEFSTKTEGAVPHFVQISKGSRHLLALSNDGVVYSWGNNSQGQLGLGEAPLFSDSDGGPGDSQNVKKTESAETGVTSKEAQDAGGSGGGPGCMGCMGMAKDSSKGYKNDQSDMQKSSSDGKREVISGTAIVWRPKKIRMGEDDPKTTEVLQVLAQGNTSFAVTIMGTVYSWGSNQNGLLHQSVLSDSEPQVQPSPVKDSSLNSYTNDDGTTSQLYVVSLSSQGSSGTIVAQVDSNMSRIHKNRYIAAKKRAALKSQGHEGTVAVGKVAKPTIAVAAAAASVPLDEPSQPVGGRSQDDVVVSSEKKDIVTTVDDDPNQIESYDHDDDSDDDIDMQIAATIYQDDPAQKQMQLDSMNAMKASLENVWGWFLELQAARMPDDELSSYQDESQTHVTGVTRTASQKSAAQKSRQIRKTTKMEEFGTAAGDKSGNKNESDTSDVLKYGSLSLTNEQLNTQITLIDSMVAKCQHQIYDLGGSGVANKDLLSGGGGPSRLSPRSPRGPKAEAMQNTFLILHLMLRVLRLYREKCGRLLCTREVVKMKRELRKIDATSGVLNMNKDQLEDVSKLQAHNGQLHKILREMNKVELNDAMSFELATAVRDSIYAKIFANDTQLALVYKQDSNSNSSNAPVQDVALKILQSVHKDLENYSLWKMFSSDAGRKIFQSRRKSADECFEQLIALSNKKLDEYVAVFEGDKIVTRDFLLPSFCYDLLMESFRLRKLCNQYQTRVLLIHKGKHLTEDPEKHVPKEEAIYYGKEDPHKATTTSPGTGISGMIGGMFG